MYVSLYTTISKNVFIRGEMFMRSSDAGFSRFLHCLYPALVYGIVSTCSGAAMQLLWQNFLQEVILRGAGPAYSYAALVVWAHLCMVVPAGAGVLFLRRTAARELALYHRDESLPLFRLHRAQSMPVLMVSVAALSLGINVCISLLTAGRGSATGSPAATVPGTLPGPAGFLLQMVVFCLFTPFVEELVFRGLLFARLETAYGLWKAVLLSGLLFGVYHESVIQGIYAFVMGCLFALLYAQTGRFMIPFALHGACNLAVLCLQWMAAYEAVCTPAWAAVFLGLGAAGLFTLYRPGPDRRR
ncbi:MAG: CPBP family intramembrane metalloprotease [Eubacteriales bacterium]|nr:CPBP family intramembrane metalloprotease [Eubacteriales bacterium]